MSFDSLFELGLIEWDSDGIPTALIEYIEVEESEEV